MAELLTTDALIALVTLTAMEIVLGIDNVVFIAILTGKLPAGEQPLARRLGLGLALGMRIVLLFAITWIMGLTRPLFSVAGLEMSGRSLILIGGGLFLMFKATWEIYDKLEVAHHEAGGRAAGSLAAALVQIMLIDVVFSLDSVITAVGMANQIAIMVVAMVIAMVVMLFSIGAVSGFVERHPSVKILALSFLLLIGVMLVGEGLGQHLPKGYIYFAMAFSLLVELLNMRFRKRQQPLALRGRFREEAG
jgi:predicted tellurium resistance membrane protein TerC